MKTFLENATGEIFVVCETHWDNRDEVLGVLKQGGFQLVEPTDDLLSDRAKFGSAQDLHFHRANRMMPHRT